MKRYVQKNRIISLVTACVLACGMMFSMPVSADDEFPLTGGAAAVTGQAKGVGYAAKLYNSENGLPTSDANTVYSSSDGFVWIGGYSGLIRYDGTTFERQDSSGGITSVNAIFEDSSHRLWVGTNDNGVVCLHNGDSRHYSYKEGLGSTSVNAITEDENGNILVATKQGVYYFDENSNISSISDSQIKNTYISKLARCADGTVCGVTKSGAVFRIKNLRLTDYYNGEDIGAGEVKAIMPSAGNPDEAWLGSNDGAVFRGSFADSFANMETYYLTYDNVEYDEESDTMSSTSMLASEPVTSIYHTSGRIWVLMGSMIFYSDGFNEFKRLENIPLNGGIENITEDFEGNLWFSSRRQGVMKIAANKFFDVSDYADLEPRIVNSTCMRNNELFIGTDTGLQIIGVDGRSLSTELIGYVGNSRVRCITVDSDNNLWLSTFTNDNGLICYTKDGQIKSYTEDDGMPSNKIRCTAEAPDGSLVVGTNDGLAVIKNGIVERVIGAGKGLGNTVILTVETGSDGKYYLGTDGDGIYVADGNNITHLSLGDGLTSDVVMRIKKDEKRGVLWIITSNSIEYMKDGVIKKVEGFPYTNNYDIYFDGGEKAWILASNGIYVANADDLISKERYDYSFYNTSDGLASVPTANSFSHLNSEGDLYVCGRTGVSRVNINSFFIQTQDIKFAVPYIEDDEYNRYFPDENGVFNIPSNAGNITIYGYALSYMMHEPQIQYFLEGADSQPITVNKSEMKPVRYTNLGGGQYTFRMSLIDSASHTERQTVSFTIVKQRTFYEQWWFILLAVIVSLFVLALIIHLAIYIRTRTILKNEEQQKRLFHQTAIALVNAIDAKDRYTHGHSSRVADYSRKIAELAGKSEKECEEIYYAALLHDVGKIGIPGSIINKDGKLTDEEYGIIKQHPTKGVQILGSIKEFPYLVIGAQYHHERYDGKGYPEGRKGTDIPEMARMISVADAYDAMTSKRSYRDPIPQDKVREEFVKGSGSQFDPEFARLMLHLIDLDTEYEMKDRGETGDNAVEDEFVVSAYRSAVYEGIHITDHLTTITLSLSSDEEATGIPPMPSMILFDSLDGKVHTDAKEIKDLMYYEYGEIMYGGDTENSGARKIQEKIIDKGSDRIEKNGDYIIEALRIKDHAMIKVLGKKSCAEIIVALPDSSRFMYIGLTGEHCCFRNIRVAKAEFPSAADVIPRIAEEITYINVPAGDIPNFQADSYRSEHSEGIEIKDGLRISFHAMSLPSARLVWHCPYIDIYCSPDGKVNNEQYHDLMFLRFDGEFWVYDENCSVSPDTEKNSDFHGWEAWKEYNKAGYDTAVTFAVDGNMITVMTENAGVSVRHTVMLNNIEGPIYTAITGDQVAITNIRYK